MAIDRPIRLLFFAHALQSRGTERALIRILTGLDRSKVSPELAVVSATGEFLDDVPIDVPLHRLEMEGRRTSSAVIRLEKLIRVRRPHVAVGVHTSASRLLASIRLVHPRLRVICFEADPFSRVEGSKGWYRLRRAATRLTHGRLATKVVAVSDFVADDIRRELRVAGEKIDVIPIPSVEPTMEALARETVPDELFDLPVVISVGHMFEHKDQQTLVKAFALVRGRRPARLAMIGDGPLRRTLEALSQELGIASDVRFLGFERNPFRYLARARVFVSPSASEGFDVSQVEAMACGVPVIVTDAPRFEAVSDGINGLVVPPGDPEAMAAAIERLLDAPDLAESLARAGKAFAAGLTTAEIAGRWDVLVTQLARDHPPRDRS